MRLCGFRIYLMLFFFFKQKTAYEMRISDWSSDVCSSDLGQRLSRRDLLVEQVGRHRPAGNHAEAARIGDGRDQMPLRHPTHRPAQDRDLATQEIGAAGHQGLQFRLAHSFFPVIPAEAGIHLPTLRPGMGRSEEHTSELQSLMRISYAVF